MKSQKLAAILAVTVLGTCSMTFAENPIIRMNSIEVSAADVEATYIGSGYQLNYKTVDNNIEITNFTKTSSASSVSVVIPSKINGCSVTSIGAYAFSGKDISSVIIPDTVVSLGNYSFYNCSKLKTVTLSKNLSSEKSGGYLFYKSKNIEIVNVPENMADPSFVDHFNYYTNTVVQGSSVTSAYKLDYKISDHQIEITSFTKTTSASAVGVIIPSTINGYNVTSIGKFAFYCCDRISSIVMPDTVISLGDYSFSTCSNLKTVTLSRNLSSEKSGGYLFYNSTSIETVYVPENMIDQTFIDHFNYHLDTVIKGSVNNSQYRLDYEIPIKDRNATITKYNANANASDNVTVTIPDTILGRNVTKIATGAFSSSNVYQVIMSNNITTLESWSFNGCANLKKLTVSKNVSCAQSGGYLFTGCNNLTDITVPADMADREFISHFQYCIGGAKLIKPDVDAKVTQVYNNLKSKSANVNWNISGLSGNAKENAKYEVAKYIHSQLASNLIRYDASYSMPQTAYALVSGKGACAGMSRSYILLLLKSGFTKDDVQLISAPGHALVGIKLYNQWYFVECTNSNPESFAMTYQNEWYNGTPEGQYDGYIIPGTYSYYCDADGTRVVSQESEAYLAQCYKSNYNRGDVNMDGVTNSSDLSILNNYLNGGNSSINLVNADVNYDGKIDSNDYNSLNDIVSGKFTFADMIKKVYGRII